jgi:hypothetical protein
VIGCPRQPAGRLPLPVPQQGGSIESLNSFLNLASRDDFVLIVAWLLAALRSGGPYPLLALSGEQGSAKTVLSKLLKALIDPNAATVRSLSREERELMIAATEPAVWLNERDGEIALHLLQRGQCDSPTRFLAENFFRQIAL